MQPELKRKLDQFLAGVERRAFNIARLAVGSSDDALDIVQDSMLALVKNYSGKPQKEWRPLFFTILNRRVVDWHRRNRKISRWELFLDRVRSDEGEAEPDIAILEDVAGVGPARHAENAAVVRGLESALATLPLRQRQAFLLRCVEGFDVAETAAAMGCSDGSVKTHLSRALKCLRPQMEEFR